MQNREDGGTDHGEYERTTARPTYVRTDRTEQRKNSQIMSEGSLPRWNDRRIRRSPIDPSGRTKASVPTTDRTDGRTYRRSIELLSRFDYVGPSGILTNERIYKDPERIDRNILQDVRLRVFTHASILSFVLGPRRPETEGIRWSNERETCNQSIDGPAGRPDRTGPDNERSENARRARPAARGRVPPSVIFSRRKREPCT